MFTLKLNKPFLMKRAVKFMNVEQVDYVAGISHKGPVLVLHDDYMLEHGTFLEFTNDLDSKICIELKWLLLLVLSNGPTLLKFLERLIFFSKSVCQMKLRFICLAQNISFQEPGVFSRSPPQMKA